MTTKNSDVRNFLTSRRAKITPDMADLTVTKGVRRVPGLRREEVAILARISVDYYTQIEKGDLSGVSDEILQAIANALQLNQDETKYLYDLAAQTRRRSLIKTQPPQPKSVPQRVQLLIDSMNNLPVIAHTGTLDILGSNRLGKALFTEVYSSPTSQFTDTVPNLASFVFLDPTAEKFYEDLDEAASTCVRILRSHAATNPRDSRLNELIEKISARNERFRALWATHDVGSHRTGKKKLRHPQVGELDLSFEQITLLSTPSIIFSTYMAEPASDTAERLQLLDSWAASSTPSQSSNESRRH